jgi:prophage maintenance system killer protein
MDGNKRTALIVAENILGQEGLFLAAGEDQVVTFMLEVASYRYEPDQIEVWMQNNAEKME